MTSQPCLRSLFALGAAVLACGCSSLDNCPDKQDDIIADNSNALIDTENLIYESAPSNGPLEAFPAKTQVIFKHGLGVTPIPKAFLSFSQNGTNGAGGGSITEAAGNEAPFECIDSQVIIVKNDTCERSFFIKVVAFGSPNGDATDTSCSP
jgi:hypothetical protein